MCKYLPLLLVLGLCNLPVPALAVGWCGGVSDSCQCGADNKYPCCDNGNGKSSNCTWGAWHQACCNWGKGLPGWSHAKFWAGNANAHPDYEVSGSAKAGTIGCRDIGDYGHVAWVLSANGGSITVREQSCCEGMYCWPNCSWCIHGFQDAGYQASYYTGGFIKVKGSNPCGNGNCDNGENCGSCPQDCGSCCGNGKCDNGENCGSCEKDCGKCPYCGDGKCSNGENCGSCSEDCGNCCGNGNCDNGENCSSCEQDCGKCCGNGKCDFGEDCASCEKDCGICNDPPEGELEVVNCKQISGWTLDPDVDGPINVQILTNGQEFTEISANLDHPKHPGHGFFINADHNLKEGTIRTVEAIGRDDKGLADKKLPGSGKKLRCRNEATNAGIWHIEYMDAGGVDITAIPGDDGWTTLQLFHPQVEYPLSGLVQATATLSNSPFDWASSTCCGGFVSPLYGSTLAIDGAIVSPLDADFGGCQEVSFSPGGTTVTATLAAMDMVVDGKARTLDLKDFSFWSRGWQWQYSGPADGMIGGSPGLDRIHFQSRENSSGCGGQLRVQRHFNSPFSGYRLHLEDDDGTPPPVLIELDGVEPTPLTCPTGTCVQEVADSTNLGLTITCNDAANPSPVWSRTISDLRVFRSFTDAMDPWQITGDQTWGLGASLPFSPDPGLTFRVSSETCDFIPHGKVWGNVTFPAPSIEEVRGMLSYNLPGSCYRAFLTVDGAPATMIDTGIESTAFAIPGPGETFGVALTALEGCQEDGADAVLEVRNVSVKRGGWWTTPSATFGGLADGRPEDNCGVTFRTLRWWGMLEKKSFGKLLTHRFLAGRWSGIRYSWKHTFEGPFFHFRLLLDNRSLRDYTLHTPAERQEELTGQDFSEVGFLFGTETPAVLPFKWEIMVLNIEVFSDQTGWVSLCEAAETDPELAGVGDSQGDDVTASADGSGEETLGGGRKSGGCSATGTSSGGAWALLLALLLAVLAVRSRCLILLPMLVLVVLSSCATSFAELPEQKRTELCTFFQSRGTQGDLLACGLEAQRTATHVIRAGGKPAPPSITAEILYDTHGQPVRIRKLSAGAGKSGIGAETCFRSALSSISVPPPGERISVPLLFQVGLLDQPQSKPGNDPVVCSVQIGL
jgi:surface antigen